ncbi:uncharacterized protein HMPREF1541_02870 [Cyphellophora europaea CBS 101466]|uniref:Transcription factor Pcc1 n=1 Tax=Cyphellophora europaea (strain CBS 101466) TaxID=1220924 RepID=W2S4T5_CYPE1|nr:uncharacterized protein HMPREF1541_02870 [Cyphellophora europaea CBS 101466]ETN43711.1 hypothetical protein HMPREF1541_02870 [Cyphellophora europaea CBS 101466]
MPADEFPCALTIDIPLPTHRLASSALRALQVDAELSPLVRRNFSLARPDSHAVVDGTSLEEESNTILRTEYRATTNRMLRVAVNGFMESLGVVLQVMEELDVDVLEPTTHT